VALGLRYQKLSWLIALDEAAHKHFSRSSFALQAVQDPELPGVVKLVLEIRPPNYGPGLLEDESNFRREICDRLPREIGNLITLTYQLVADGPPPIP